MGAPPKLPIGIQTFEEIRRENYVYVDKTRYLIDLIDNGKAYFLSRPRRFGKSLTVSAFGAIFSGEKELFKGLDAEEYFERPGYRVSPVISLDMSLASALKGESEFEYAVLDQLESIAKKYNIEIERVSIERTLTISISVSYLLQVSQNSQK